LYLLEQQNLLASPPAGSLISNPEFEVLCRLNLEGILDLGPVILRPWDIYSPEGGKHPRSLHITLRLTSTEELQREAEDYYYPGFLIAEIVTLLTLFTRAHFVLERQIRFNADAPLLHRFENPAKVSTSPVDGRRVRLADLSSSFRSLEGMRRFERTTGASRLEPFMLASRFYALARAIHETSEDIAYILLVSAIETLTHDFEVPALRLEEIDARLADLLRSSVVDASVLEEIERRVLAQQRRISRRFREFVPAYLPERFWQDDTRPPQEYMRFRDREHLRTYLDRIYAARSKAVHEGAPFPAFPTAGMNIEVPFYSGVSIGRRQWNEDVLIPSFRGFENVVHHVLVEYLRVEGERA
jgi:hypothetical protein